MDKPSVLDKPVSLPTSRHAPALAREEVAKACSGWPSATVETAVLLVSELVTNAVVHGGAGVGLRICRSERRLRVEVRDRGRQNLRLVPHPRLDDESGRGLRIVAALASTWGHEADKGTGGKLVWFELGRPPETLH